MSAPFFEVKNANVWREDVLALHQLNFKLEADESVAILGANGAGKSSLLKLMTGEVRTEANPGSYCKLFGEELWCLEELRHRMGLVMPEEVSRFDPEEVAADVVHSAFRGAYGRTGDMRFKADEKQKAQKAMENAGVGKLSKRLFGQLSSGEKRRFLIARALVHEPEILVLDEPSTALDFAARLAMLEHLRSIANSTGSIVLVTHDPGEVIPEINRVILLQAGRVIADGAKKQVLTSASLSELYGMHLKLQWNSGWPVVRPIL
jgi:iron complex transport system ATP-binding protein